MCRRMCDHVCWLFSSFCNACESCSRGNQLGLGGGSFDMECLYIIFSYQPLSFPLNIIAFFKDCVIKWLLRSEPDDWRGPSGQKVDIT